jgi:hypothetical protein
MKYNDTKIDIIGLVICNDVMKYNDTKWLLLAIIVIGFTG